MVGSGPAGMMLAGELALAGVDVAVMERRETSELVGSRAGGFHSRTIEILDQRGIADRFLAEGQIAQTARFGTAVLDISDFPTRHPYGLALWQNRIEPILADWIEQLGVRIERGREVTGFVQHDRGVDVVFREGEAMRAKYLVGADGGRSVIRKAAGIEFPGWEATRSNLIAEVEVTEEPPGGMVQDERGVHALHLMEDGHTYRVVTTERQIGPATEPTLSDLSSALTSVYGTDFGVHDPTWISRFTDATRQAAAYRSGRVLLAGDAAHIHYPAGGQGIGLGIQDAVNLGWKLAQVVSGVSPQALLDTYHAERHPAGARALRHSMAQTALQRADPRTAALSETIDDLMTTAPARRQVAGAHPRPRRRLRPRGGTSASRTTDAGPRPRHPGGPDPGLRAAARRPTGAPRLRRLRAHRHLALGRPSPCARRAVHRRVADSGRRGDRISKGCARQARRSRGMGRSRKRRNTHRRAHALVRAEAPSHG